MNLSSTIRTRVARTATAAGLSLVIMLGVMAANPHSSYAASTVARGGTALIAHTDGDTIRVRSGASTSYDQVAEAHEGETVSVLDGPAKDAKGNTWYKISGPGGAGWIMSDFLTGKSSPSSGGKETVSVARGGTATVANTDGDTIRVRSGASTSYDQVAEAHEGETVSVLDGPAKDSKGQVWYKISGPGGTGWMMSDFLVGKSAPAAKPETKPQTAPAKKAAPSGPKLTGFARVGNSDGDPVRLRTKASSSASVITEFSPNTSVAIKDGPVVDSEDITWYQVSGNGQTGWMMAEFLIQADAPAPAPAAPATAPETAPAPAPAPVVAPAAPSAPVAPQEPAAPAVAPQAPAPAPEAAPPAAPAPAPAAPAPAPATDPARTGESRGAEQPQAAPVSRAEAIVSTALKYVGSRYVSGGVGPRSFDCSGFVYYILNHSGMKISRDMGSQWNSGTHISSSNLQPGDLVFFSNTYKRGLSHVGIYIGNGRFVHAENQSTGVRVSDLWSSYYKAHYTGAVRPGR